MKPFWLVLALFVVTASADAPQSGSASLQGSLMKTQTFLDSGELAQTAYALGFLDGVFMGGAIPTGHQESALKALGKCIGPMKAKQITAIIEKYMRNHPEHWHWQAGIEAWNAMQEACPVDGEK